MDAYEFIPQPPTTPTTCQSPTRQLVTTNTLRFLTILFFFFALLNSYIIPPAYLCDILNKVIKESNGKSKKTRDLG